MTLFTAIDAAWMVPHLAQTAIWTDKHQIERPLVQIDVEYLSNILRFLEAHADLLVVAAGWPTKNRQDSLVWIEAAPLYQALQAELDRKLGKKGARR